MMITMIIPIIVAFMVINGVIHSINEVISNNVLLVKIEGPVWYTIHHHLPFVEGVNTPLY